MKKTIFTFIFAIFLTSCDFLDVVPQDSATQADMFSSVQDIEYSLNMIYGNIPSVYFGNSVPDWTLGNEVTTTYDNPPRWAPWKGIWYGYENANATNFALWTDVVNGYGSGLRLYNAIRLAWWFVNHCKAATDVDDLSEEDRNDFLGQAYFMIAYYHWVLMEHYGPVVIRDHEITSRVLLGMNAQISSAKCSTRRLNCCPQLGLERNTADQHLPRRKPTSPGS